MSEGSFELLRDGYELVGVEAKVNQRPFIETVTPEKVEEPIKEEPKAEEPAPEVKAPKTKAKKKA